MKDFFSRLSGASTRYNRTLDAIRDWSDTVREFVNRYDIDENTGVDKLLGDSGNVKFDLTSIVFKGRPLIEQALKVKTSEISDIIADIIENAEGIRRYLINPALQMERLHHAVAGFLSSLETLRNRLEEAEYL